MLTVPDIVQRLVAHHGVDAVALDAELAQHERVRTRDWLAGSQNQRQRHVLRSLPPGFPSFKATVTKQELRVEGMNLGGGAILSMGVRYVRLTMPWPDLPETLILALPGRPLSQFIGHVGIGDSATITSIAEDERDGERCMVVGMDMPRAPLQPVDMSASTTVVPADAELDAIIAVTHGRLDVAPLTRAQAMDTRTWHEQLGVARVRLAGIRVEHADGATIPSIALRFPYDKATAKAVGRARVGAWFDRRKYCWMIEPTTLAMNWLCAFIAQCDVVIGPDGAIHCRRPA